MTSQQRPAFVSERISPEAGSADLNAMARGEPGVPRAFTWRDSRFEVAHVLATERDMGKDRGDVYVRRHYFDLETTDLLRMRLYFERNPKDRTKPKAWWLYTVTFPAPVIVTARLALRRWTYADRGDFRAMLADADMMRFLHEGLPMTATDADAALDKTIAHYSAGFGDWAIVSLAHGEILGEAGLTTLRESGEVELGYMLRRPFWGQGLATEAARAVMAHAFSALELSHLFAMVRPDNRASIHVLEKLGMRPDGLVIHRGHEMAKFEAP
jgi:ribosomal-protein-alanine N-acetyltransferase